MEDVSSAKRLLMTLALNFIIPAAQIVGGIISNSVALISDAMHNFSDFTAVLISYVAFKIGQRGASAENTFGYRRAEVMAALINGAILVGASIFIVYEAVGRFQNPQPVLGKIVMVLAAVGILGNGFSALLLHRDAKHNLNIRGAFLHMMGDLLTSVVVLINGMILVFRPWYWLDPLLSMLIVLFILKNCWDILREATGVLMNATPKGLDIAKVKDFLEKIPGVRSVHYLHAWNVSSPSIAFSCHVQVEDQAVSKTEVLVEKIRHELYHRFGIDHPVLQFETIQCGNGGLLCEISCSGKLNSGHTILKRIHAKIIKEAAWKSQKTVDVDPALPF
ncbi:MAG: cation transporter [Deltaproteobacteria bacterium]|nr:cation transporter [Deltaproteobacteria bacterium]MBW2152284.1 cation transporter [Deltaproteobacteria bacterium]